jgi:S-adenosylmethionine synthetase
LRKLISSESVTEGHPDKLADRISDSLLDAILTVDPEARVAAETVVSTGLALITGETRHQGQIDLTQVVRQAVREVGYTDADYGFDADTAAVLLAINEQSPDIARGVDNAQEAGSGDALDRIGAGDQGIMFGYAVSETPGLMPLPITLAHGLARRLAQVRHSDLLPWLRPDGKTQVTVAYEAGEPVAVTSVVVSAQHDPDVGLGELRRQLEQEVVRHVIDPALLQDTQILINPTGRFVTGGPQGDAGLTGRKIIVDTYGGAAQHGGGAFSGKDPTKVDRSGSYYARYMAKNIVAAGLATRCQIQLAYAIGVARPVGMYVETFGTGVMSDERLSGLVSELFDARPAAMITQLDLKKPIYSATSAYGHFGRPEFPWEKTDRVNDLLEAASRG